MVEQMREFGLFGATIPEEYGGLGLSASSYAKIVEAISGVWISLTGVLNSHLMMAELIRRFGTDEHENEMLPLLAAGEWRGGLALTEPDCGSDLQAIRTVARLEGNEYVINGSKTWITNAGNGNCLALLVKTDTEAQPRYKGMTLIVVRKSDGYVVPRNGARWAIRGSTPSSWCSMTCAFLPTGSSVLSRVRDSSRRWERLSWHESTSPLEAWAWQRPRSKPRSVTAVCEIPWANPLASTKQYNSNLPTRPAA